MDDADRAQEAMEVLDAARSRPVHAAEAEATGHCLWCDARLVPNAELRGRPLADGPA